jgi:hypothetical protein
MRQSVSEIVSLRNHPERNEWWIQARLANEPAILGLSDLDLKQR